MQEPTGLSYSSITTFEQCQYKYMRLYDGEVDGKVSRAHAHSAVEGSLVHDVLERWHQDRTQDWREIMKDVIATKVEGGKRAYDALLSGQFIGAQELLNEYMARKDIYPKIHATEVPFEFVLPNGIPVRGRIDRIDDLGNGHYSLVDYKTTRTYIWKSEVENSLQGMMYVLVARNFLFPSAKKFSFTIDALRFSPITVEFSERQLQAALDYLEVIFNSIKETKAQDAKPRINKFCGYCQLQDECPAFKMIKAAGLSKALDFEGQSIAVTAEDVAEKFLVFSEWEEVARKGKQQMESKLDGYLEELQVRDYTFGAKRVFYEKTKYGNPKLKVEDLTKQERDTDGV